MSYMACHTHMNAHTSQINSQHTMSLLKCKHSYSHRHNISEAFCICVCVSRSSLSEVYSAWGLHLTDGCYAKGNGPNVTRGKYYCRADLCLKVLPVSFLCESCSPDPTRHHQPHERLSPRCTGPTNFTKVCAYNTQRQ